MANSLKIDRRAEKEKQQAGKNRRELVAAGIGRRELIKMAYHDHRQPESTDQVPPDFYRR
jgi:hypothetical protein